MLTNLSISDLAYRIQNDWKNVNYAARPYLSAMFSMNTIDDMYGCDDGYGIVAYFLNNAGSWRGNVAREVKAELKRRLKNAQKR